jgi:hypothetical protein
MKKLVMVSLSVVVPEEDADYTMTEMLQSHIAQMGWYTWGSTYRELTPDELKEVESQLPDDIWDDVEVIEDEETGQREITIIRKDKSNGEEN